MKFMQDRTHKLTINSIGLDKIIFSVTPDIPFLSKYDLSILLNERPFRKFHFIHECKGEKAIYSIIPFQSFKYTDTLYIQIQNSCFESYRYKIDFALALNEGFAKTKFSISGSHQGKYCIKLEKINGVPINLKSNSFVVSRPIDKYCSSVCSCKRTYDAGECIELLLYLINIDGTPVPDGFYEIEIIESDD